MIIVDTNIFILTVTTSFPLFKAIRDKVGPVTIATASSVVAELNSLSDEGNQAAEAATDLIESKALKIVSGSTSYADNDIVALAGDNDVTAVLTHDHDLISELKQRGVTVYRPRQEQYLIQA